MRQLIAAPSSEVFISNECVSLCNEVIVEDAAHASAAMRGTRPSRQAGFHPAAAMKRLTAEEREVLRMLAGGGSSVEIARELGTEPDCVRDQVQSILTKLRVSSRREALELYGPHVDP